MAGTKKMNTRERASTDERRTAETYSVDLTSVCVKSGTLNLPLKLIDRFDVGSCTVVIAGTELALTVEKPRRLVGLRAFFDEQQLRPNDSVLFAFTGERIEVSARKRERSRTAAPRSEAQPKPANDVAKGGQSDPIRSAAQGAASAAPQGGGSGQQPRLDLSPVKRVRIETDVPLNPDTVAPRPLDLASARDVWARRERPAWRSLTALAAEAGAQPDEELTNVTVRVVRRSQGLSVPLATEAHTTIHVPASKEAARPTVAPAAAGTGLGSSPERGGPRISAPRPTERQPERAVRLDPYLDAPIDASAIDDDYRSSPDPAFRTEPLARGAGVTSGAAKPVSETTTVGAVSSDAPEAVAAPAYARFQRGSTVVGGAPASLSLPVSEGDRLGQESGPVAAILNRFGLGRAPRQGASDGARYVSGAPVGRDSTDTALDRSSASWLEDEGATFEPSGWSGDETSLRPPAEPAPARPARGRSGGPSAGEPAVAPSSRTANGVTPVVGVIIDESVYDVDFQTGQWGTDGAGQGHTDVLTDDIGRLDVLLSSPAIPAIVRCEDLAARLSLPHDRVERAMERLSEDTERFTTLRQGAYMIRRRAP